MRIRHPRPHRRIGRRLPRRKPPPTCLDARSKHRHRQRTRNAGTGPSHTADSPPTGAAPSGSPPTPAQTCEPDRHRPARPKRPPRLASRLGGAVSSCSGTNRTGIAGARRGHDLTSSAPYPRECWRFESSRGMTLTTSAIQPARISGVRPRRTTASGRLGVSNGHHPSA
jgi:hypothetical protein